METSPLLVKGSKTLDRCTALMAFQKGMIFVALHLL
jgi:hypothetical protein